MNLDDVETAVGRLTATADIGAGRWWDQQLFSPIQAFREVVERRQEIEAVVRRTRATRRSVAELEWTRNFHEAAPSDSVEDLRAIAGVRPGPGTSAGGAAITVARVLRWLVTVWSEIEQVKNRRSYVREGLGDPEALPQSWLAAVRTASTMVLPL
jgi:hypothetical protein